MHAQFWHERWASNQIGFHESEVNGLLVAHVAALAVPVGGRVFVPLCGKTLDIDWLLSRGHRVAAAELSEVAVAELFERLGLTPAIARHGGLQRWSAPGVEVFVGDIFDLSDAMLGAVDAVYDRAALIALPPEMRPRYAAHLGALAKGAPQLLVTLDYDSRRMDGPPFSVTGEEVRRLHAGYEPTLLATAEVPGGLKGRCPATEQVWLLRERRRAQPPVSAS